MVTLKSQDVFEALTLIEHPNIVNFHKFWTDSGDKDKGTLPRYKNFRFKLTSRS